MKYIFGKKELQPRVKYDPEIQRPVVRCSICTGEQAAGFKDKKTGRFTEVMLIRNTEDLDCFMKMYNLSSVEKEY